MPSMQTRRRFLTTLSLAGAAGLLRAPPSAGRGGRPRNDHRPACRRFLASAFAPQYVAEELLRAEGFTDIRYVDTAGGYCDRAIGRGKIDFGLQLCAAAHPAHRCRSMPITVLAGVHVGCFELFANDGIRSIADLKGKSVGVQDWGSTAHVLLALMAAHVGLDPVKDIRWVTDPSVKPIELFAEGKIDAFLGFPPEPQDLRARQDRPCDRQQHRGPPLVAVFLLHAGRQPGLCAQIPGRDQARAAGHPQGRRSLRHRADARRAADRRWRLHRALRLCAADAERDPLRQMARIRRRGHDPVLRAAPARDWASSSRARRRSSPTAPIGAS